MGCNGMRNLCFNHCYSKNERSLSLSGLPYHSLLPSAAELPTRKPAYIFLQRNLVSFLSQTDLIKNGTVLIFKMVIQSSKLLIIRIRIMMGNK